MTAATLSHRVVEQALLDEVEALRECPHVEHEIRCRTTANGRHMYGRQCLKCGRLVNGKWLPHAAVRDATAVKPWDHQLEERRGEYSRVLWDLRREWYAEYLASPEWRERRRLVWERANGWCEGCREREAEHVHHLTYAHVGEEFLWELVAICAPCHDRAHGITA